MTTEQYSKAISQLEKALAQPKDEFIRDSVIQRFEFTFELAWKTAKRVLGTQSVGTKIIIREMAQQGFISDTALWFDLLEARNLSVHTYKEELAEKVYTLAKDSISEFKQLLNKLDEYS